MSGLSGSCWKCGAEISASEYGRSDSCSRCRNDTRCCRNCQLYDRTVHNECREPAAERVLDKDRSNFCEFFKPGRPKREGSSPGLAPQPSGDARAAFDKLFREKE